jgi:hypothetical protein
MKTVDELLRDADPLRREPPIADETLRRLRQCVVAAASEPGRTGAMPWRASLAIAATVVLAVILVSVGGWLLVSPATAALHAAVRFECRLAETQPAAGLREAKIAGTGRIIYLHPEAIVSNEDIATSEVIAGDSPSSFGVSITFTKPGAEKMHKATSGAIGHLVAILIDGDLVAAPVLRAAIGESAVITGRFTKAEAGRIADGIRLR